MSMRNAVRSVLIVGLSVQAAYAEEFPVLEEVVVTAQRVAQSVQDVPISMVVLDSEMLDRNNIIDFGETMELTPGVSANTNSPTLAAITVRGVGAAYISGAAQAVPVFVDEMPVAAVGAVFSTLVDVERIELLRGPQGTLYGKNAPSGAYNISTVAPSTNGVEGMVRATYSQWDSNGEPSSDLRGAINLPFTNDIAMRVSGVYGDSDGGIDLESPLAEDDTAGGKDHKSARVRLLWNISDTSSLDVISNYQDLEDTYAFVSFDGLVPGTGGSNQFEEIYTEFKDREDYSDFASRADTDVKDIGFHYRLDADITNFDVILGYQDYETFSRQAQTPHPSLTPGYTDLSLDQEQVTLEVRVSDSGDFVDYVGGVFLRDADQSGGLFNVTEDLEVPSEIDYDVWDAAVFANVTWHLAEKLDLTTGLRYDDNQRDVLSDASVLIPGIELGGMIDDELNFDHLSWSIKLNYFVSDNTTGYLAIDNAYRVGGVNVFTPALQSLGAAVGSELVIQLAEEFAYYDEETSTAFEIGLKGTALDDRLRYNTAVFYQVFDDHILRQAAPLADELVNTSANGLLSNFNVNAEEVVTQGVEFDVTYLVSENWTSSLAVAYFDATVEEWDNRLCSYGDDLSGGVFCPADGGEDLAAVPKWSTNYQLYYTKALDSGWAFSSNLSWTWRPEVDGSFDIDRYNDSLNLVNLNAGLGNEQWSIVVWGKNLTDEHTHQLVYEFDNGDSTLPPALTGTHNPGREYGMTVGYNF